MSVQRFRKPRPAFYRKIDGRRHVVREILCSLGFHARHGFGGWCWYCGELRPQPGDTE